MDAAAVAEAAQARLQERALLEEAALPLMLEAMVWAFFSFSLICFPVQMVPSFPFQDMASLIDEPHRESPFNLCWLTAVGCKCVRHRQHTEFSLSQGPYITHLSTFNYCDISSSRSSRLHSQTIHRLL